MCGIVSPLRMPKYTWHELELIRTLQDKGIHSGIDIFMECTISKLLQDGDGRVNGAFGYWRETGRVVELS